MFEFLHQIESDAVGIWTFVHLLAGVVGGFAAATLRLNGTIGLVTLMTLAVMWEVFELSMGISESLHNRIVDVAVAVALYIPSFFIVHEYVKSRAAAVALTICAIILYGGSLYFVFTGII